MGAERERRYWGLHLDERSRKPTPARSEWRPPFSLQLLAVEGGPTEQIAYFDQAAEVLELAGRTIDARVLAAVKALPVGTGEYLTAEGDPFEPF